MIDDKRLTSTRSLSFEFFKLVEQRNHKKEIDMPLTLTLSEGVLPRGAEKHSSNSTSLIKSQHTLGRRSRLSIVNR